MTQSQMKNYVFLKQPVITNLLFFIFVISTVNRKYNTSSASNFADHRDSNRVPFAVEATTLPTEQRPLHKIDVFSTSLNYTKIKLWTFLFCHLQPISM